ncbi:PH domain-containing protein [Bacillus gobiensis]|uniref:PH domain-containing protein n=1 Tax=Bacillus gobiensis TaxID=1441095 RepID=UPI003D23EEA7
MMSEPKRMHPAAMILNLISGVINIVKQIVIPFAFIFFVNSNAMIQFFALLGLAVLLIVVIVFSVLQWRKFTYRIEEDELRIEEGLIRKKRRYIPIERIQSVNTSEGIIQQLFKLVKLQVETAGGGKESEVSLKAITKHEAERIQKELFDRKQKISSEEIQTDVNTEEELESPVQNLENEADVTYKMGAKELFIAASTSSGIGVIISGIVAFVTQFDEILPIERIYERFSFLNNAGLEVYALLVFIGLIIAWILSMIGVLLKYANFTVIRKNKEIIISKGLIEKNRVTIPMHRIQAIKIKENLIRQPLKYATVMIVSAGGSESEKNTSTLLFPVIPKKMVRELLQQYVEGYTYETDITPLPARSLRRYLIRYGFFPLIAGILLSIFLSPWGYLGLVLIPVSLLLGYFAYKDAGWNLTGDKLQMTYRDIGKTTAIVLRKKMQIYEVKQTYFQKKNKLATIHTSTKSSVTAESFSITDTEWEDAQALFQWYSYEKRVNG